MLSVDDARSRVLAAARPLPPQEASLSTALLGCVLAEEIVSDIDMPPYDKSMMDGYALRHADLQAGKATLEVVEEITAGKVPTRPVEAGQASRIMTGAPIPEGADVVVMIERTTLEGDRVKVDDPTLQIGKNILPRAKEMRRGDVVLAAGATLRPQEFGLLATVGRAAARVHLPPSVAVLATGDELVEPGNTPGDGQIRNSNGPMLMAQAARAGAAPVYLGIARDRADDLREKIAQGLTHAVLLLSGGVSAGKLDLVPGVLQELGVEPNFHRIRMKPGKPLFFGTKSNGDRPTTLVFGLPGNPVSSLVCFEMFVRPALERLANKQHASEFVQARIVAEFHHQSDRPTYHPSRLDMTANGFEFRALPWFGSADLRALSEANALAMFPEGTHVLSAGQVCSVLPMDRME